MSKTSSRKLSPRDEATSYAMIFGFGGFFVSYFAAEVFLTGDHAYHLPVAISGAVTAGAIAYAVRRLRLGSRFIRR
jgi:hypothetical protein